MGYSYKTYAETKDVMKKYVNATEGSIIYSMSKTHLMTLVNEAGALYKVGNSALINTEILVFRHKGRRRERIKRLACNSRR